MKLLASLLCLGLLVGCEQQQETARTTKNYEITHINRPKHFYVDIRDIESGKIYKHLYVSKHCNAWRSLKIGSRWDFQEVKYKTSESEHIKIEGVKNLCKQLQMVK